MIHHSRRLAGPRGLLVLLATVTLAWPASASATPLTVPRTGGTSGVTLAATPSLAQLIGQKLIVAMSGTTPSASLLGRVQRGEVGGVILFGANIASASQVASLTSRLRAAASAGGQPKLLIATDQEGGSVKRVPWAPPSVSVPQMGASGSAATATSQGTSTGHILACAGIDSDIAPVADVPASTASFMYQEGRTWSFSAATTATLSDAFATGLRSGGDVPVMKHFPGLGFASANTDSSVVTITASKAALAPGLQPYQTAIGHAIPMIMLSNATYTAYDGANGAGWSRAIGVGLLRTSLGFTGVTVTDSLSGTAAARGVSVLSLATKAAQAGTDMILVTGSEASTASVYSGLVQAATAGQIPSSVLQASYTRILALKSKIAPLPTDAAPPSVAAPASRLYAPSTLGSTTAPVRTSWSATDACGVSAYSLERSTSGGAYSFQSLPSSLATSAVQSLAVGTVYRFGARASDGAGNTSGWAHGPSFMPVLNSESSSYAHYAGTWASAASSEYSGGAVRYSLTTGASVSFTFTGASIGWVTEVGPTRGSAKIYVDGSYVTTVSTYATTRAFRRIAWATSWASQGSHTLRIVVVGTAGHPRVDIDAFVRLYRP